MPEKSSLESVLFWEVNWIRTQLYAPKAAWKASPSMLCGYRIQRTRRRSSVSRSTVFMIWARHRRSYLPTRVGYLGICLCIALTWHSCATSEIIVPGLGCYGVCLWRYWNWENAHNARRIEAVRERNHPTTAEWHISTGEKGHQGLWRGYHGQRHTLLLRNLQRQSIRSF